MPMFILMKRWDELYFIFFIMAMVNKFYEQYVCTQIEKMTRSMIKISEERITELSAKWKKSSNKQSNNSCNATTLELLVSIVINNVCI